MIRIKKIARNVLLFAAAAMLVIVLVHAANASTAAHAITPVLLRIPGGGGGASTPPTVSSQCALVPSALSNSIEKNESWYCPINEQVYSAWLNYLPLALIVLLLAFFIASMIFMVGTALRNQKMRNFGIGEIYEVLASALIIGLFVYISAVMFGIVPAVFVGPINPFATSLHLITSTISSAENIYTSLFNVYMTDAFIKSISVSITTPVTNTKVLTSLIESAQEIIFLLFMEPAQVLASYIADGIFALYAEYYLILFFAVAAIPVFLIPGVIFRVMIPTRALGGMMIALALGFYFVMPIMFSVAYYFTAPQLMSQLSAESLLLNRFNTSSVQLSSINPSNPAIGVLSEINTSMQSFWLLILFYPALIISVTYAFVVQVANFIGGAAQMGGRIRGGFI
ncbi:hypothetical protein M1439_01450 [Candidatus Marsarchaeota archaeon]|jgi:hypothetical protein|nr:hypothetical protein [Candidatus Marsarchaeota archaeon]MCL5092423.1 hypothetical protein [Candidatus Marsarchaeota archaeon]